LFIVGEGPSRQADQQYQRAFQQPSALAEYPGPSLGGAGNLVGPSQYHDPADSSGWAAEFKVCTIFLALHDYECNTIAVQKPLLSSAQSQVC
jgi:hypothetical protein